MTLAFVSFAAPVMLAGLALLSLPVIAHLLNRRARRQVVFPSVVLLMEAWANQSQLFRLRRLILLLLRCLAIALIVLAFAWPMWVESEAATATGDDSAAMVLLVDVSASTGQEVRGVSAMSSLRAAAGRAVDALLSGADVANVVRASARPEPVFASMTANLQAVRQELATLEPTAERADFVSAFAVAGELLAGHAGPRHLVVLTDLQATNWQAVPEQLAAAQPLPADTRLTLVALDAPAQANVALARPAVEPAQPVLGQGVTASVELANFAEHDQTVQVELLIDDEPRDARSVSLEPWQRQTVPFELTLHEPGPRRVSFAIGDDALAIDNRAHVVVRVAQRERIVVVGDDNPHELGSVSYFLTRGLAPHLDDRNRYAVDHIAAAELRPAQLAGSAGVILGHVGRLDDRAVDTLAQHLAAGGGVAMFAAGDALDANLLALDEAMADVALPLAVGPVRDASREGELLRLGEGRWDAGPLRIFDGASREAIGRARFRRVRALDVDDQAATIHLRYHDATPALVTAAPGPGRLMIVNFSPALEHSDIGQFGGFVALLHALAGDLAPTGPARARQLAGDALAMTSHHELEQVGPSPRVLGPDGRAVPDAEFSGAVGTAEGLTAIVPRAAEPGFYRLVRGETTLAIEAVNVDPRESDLRQLDRTELEAALAQAGTTVEMRSGAEAQVLNVRGVQLWGWMLAAALVALAAEMALVSWWRR